MLINEVGDIVAFIDWEFAYSAPTQFSLDPPWWLLLDVPETWHTNIDDWAKSYSLRLETWLQAMEKAENDTNISLNDVKLSTYMRESWATGRFWLDYAARKSWAFDTIFWKYLDERFYGERPVGVAKKGLWKTRVDLLSEEERVTMEVFTQRKMEESKKRILVDWDDAQVKEGMSEVLFQD
ncbi:putative phosphotransferase enzyme family protein [Eutypa lata UCREL1]|uniref:Putative phosphotransferase enzyme family protein n=1 Tax=Eutypa lata (strain UCR-EL1) TaxID=1287681 RepID=M7T468_EUTLA|nr:putative phosphotransferase enzyme family protein [Eutypa lata UCREL1]